MHRKKYFKLLMSISACAVLAACQTTSPQVQDEQNRSAKIDTALERAATSAASRGEGNQSLPYLEKIYKRNSSDPAAAVAYGHALREADYLSRAELVLGPFAKDDNGPAEAKTEYAAVQLAQGNYESAEEYAQRAILLNEKDYEAYHYLGIALDAQGMHPEAERAFRKALDYWQGDPTTVMNNLALNLASQNFVDEAAEILRKAQAIAPDRVEIERNLRIVMALQQTGGRNAPKPKSKPESFTIKQEEVVVEPSAGSTAVEKVTVEETTVKTESQTYGPPVMSGNE